jgi:putative inorganic carbon (HCO3(-)) transporter
MGTGLGHFLPQLLYVFFLLGCVISLFRPRFGIFVLIPCLPQQTGRYHLLDYPLGNHFIDLLMLSIAAGLILSGKRLFPKTPFGKVFAALFIVSYIGLWAGSLILGATPPVWFTQRVMDWIYYMRLPMLFYLVLASIESVRQIKILLVLMCLSFLWVEKGFYQSMRGRNTSHYNDNIRDAGPLGWAGQNGLAAFELECTVFLIGPLACLGWKLHYRAAILAMGAAGVLGVLFSYSRGAYMGMAGAAAYAGIFKMRILLVALVLTIVAAPAILPRSVIERILMTYDAQGRLESSAQERVDLWNDAMHLIQKEPIFGVGYDGFAIYRGQEAQETAVNQLRDTHNMYVRALIESGLVGLVILIVLFVSLFRVGHALFREARDPFLRGLGLGFATQMVAVILCNCFGDRWTFIEISGFTFTLAAIVTRARWITQESEPADAEIAGGAAPITTGLGTKGNAGLQLANPGVARARAVRLTEVWNTYSQPDANPGDFLQFGRRELSARCLRLSNAWKLGV